MTIQKKILDLTGSQYLVQKVKSAINDVDSSLSTHIADTDIHVTTSDKTTWNTVSSKANDSDVVHKSGDETVNGTKTFKDMISIDGDYLGNEASTNQRTNLCLRANRDTAGKSGAYITRFRQNRAQGALAFSDQQQIGIDFLENSVRTKNLFTIVATDWTDDVAGKILINSGIANNSFGSTTRKCYINELNPSSLGMPDLNNGIDISSYITDLTGSPNIYISPANGYIILRSTTANVLGIVENTTGMGTFSRGSNQVLAVYLPVVKNSSTSIYTICSSLTHAKFIPCQGNV